jgi:hypothetical protein
VAPTATGANATQIAVTTAQYAGSDATRVSHRDGPEYPFIAGSQNRPATTSNPTVTIQVATDSRRTVRAGAG